MEKAFAKNKGALHKQLGVPQGTTIPAGKLKLAAASKGKLGQRARAAENARHANSTMRARGAKQPVRQMMGSFKHQPAVLHCLRLSYDALEARRDALRDEVALHEGKRIQAMDECIRVEAEMSVLKDVIDVNGEETMRILNAVVVGK